VIRLLIYSVLSLSSLLQSQTPESRSPEEARESKTIKHVQELPASKLDPKLSALPFASWFKSVLGPGAALKWEVNDCGEQTGDPKLDAGCDFPTCVEADATNPHKAEIEIVVSINVGSINKGSNQKPQFGFAALRLGNRFLFPEQLHCLPKLLVANPDSDVQQLRRMTGCKITEGKQ
jgi:hypothetical protein